MKKWVRAPWLFASLGWGLWFLLALIFRLVRLVGQEAGSWLLYLDALRYAWGFYVLALVIGWGVLWWVERRLSHLKGVLMLTAAQLGILVMCFMEMAAFNFWKVTGTQLDYFLIDYAFSDIGGVLHLVGDSTPWYFFVIFGALVLLIVAVPGLLLWRFGASQREDRAPVSASMKRGVALLLASCLVASWPTLGQGYTFAQVAPSPWFMGVSWWDFTRQASGDGRDREALSALTQPHLIKPKGKAKNIVFIVLESTRAISVNPYQQAHKTTPYLESLTKESLWAKRAYAVVPHTSKALVAILCGVEPNLEMPIQEAKAGGLPAQCLAKLLGEHGYKSVFFQSATQRFEWREQLVKNMGYQEFFPQERMKQAGFERANYFGSEDAVMLEPGLKWAREAKGPFMMTFLTLTPHHNYLAPRKRYGYERFAENDELDRYLNTLRYVDHFTKELIEGFKREGRYEDTIFVVVGDHGEGFNEHGRSQHDNVIYEEGLRVPLIIHDPSRPKEQAIDYNVNQLDIIPTALSMAGWIVDPAQWRGQDMREIKSQRQLRAHCWYNRRCMAQIEGDDKYIYHFDNQPDERFDLSVDPQEKVALKAPQDEQIRGQLQRWRMAVLQTYKSHYAQALEAFIKAEPPASMQHELHAKIGDWVTLLGYDVEPAQGPYRPGQRVTVTSYYKVHKEIEDGWMLFAHGVDGKDRMISNLDHIPVEGFYGLEQWKAGQFITDRHTFNIPTKKAAGNIFEIHSGFWHKSKDRVKIEVKDADRLDAKGRLVLARFPMR